MSKNFIKELEWRGMLQDSIPGCEDQLLEKSCSGYIGFDPTADSLHIGSLVQILILSCDYSIELSQSLKRWVEIEV